MCPVSLTNCLLSSPAHSHWRASTAVGGPTHAHNCSNCSHMSITSCIHSSKLGNHSSYPTSSVSKQSNLVSVYKNREGNGRLWKSSYPPTYNTGHKLMATLMEMNAVHADIAELWLQRCWATDWRKWKYVWFTLSKATKSMYTALQDRQYIPIASRLSRVSRG